MLTHEPIGAGVHVTNSNTPKQSWDSCVIHAQWFNLLYQMSILVEKWSSSKCKDLADNVTTIVNYYLSLYIALQFL